MLLNKVVSFVAPPLGATVGLFRAGVAACQCVTVTGGIYYCSSGYCCHRMCPTNGLGVWKMFCVFRSVLLGRLYC